MKTIIVFLFCNSMYLSFIYGQNVGIGTTTPKARLEVKKPNLSTIRISSDDYADTSRLVFSNRNISGIGTDLLWTSYQENGLRLASESDLAQNTNANIMHIKANGNIGVNFDDPALKFEVNGEMSIRNNNMLEFGRGVAGKETNAGKIGYGVFGYPDALSIVGAGASTGLLRKIRLWSEAGTTVVGPAFIEGNLAVGTTIVPLGYKMSVDGKIIAEELRIQNSTAWPDYVFADDYTLPSLIEVKKHIYDHHHLIGVPSAAEVSVHGTEVGDMQKILLKKIEELTLYILDLQNQINDLKVKANEK